MTGFTRYAIYAAPGGDLADFGARWLGWDMETGSERHDPALHEALPALDALTQNPRKYGFHGTLKAPFRLASGQGEAALREAFAIYAARTRAAQAGPLEVARLGHFMALCPAGDTDDLDALAFDIVQVFDPFRAPLTGADLTRRRAAGLSPEQDAHLIRWGYPFVGDQFRFHMTLTGPLARGQAAPLRAVLDRALAPMLGETFVLDRIALVGERARDGRFEVIAAHPLTVA